MCLNQKFITVFSSLSRFDSLLPFSTSGAETSAPPGIGSAPIIKANKGINIFDGKNAE